MPKISCEEARDLLDSVKAELDILKLNIQNFNDTGDQEALEKCELRKELFLETVDELMEGLKLTKLEKAKEILGEEHVFQFKETAYVPFSVSQLENIRAMNDKDDQRRQTNLVYFEPENTAALVEENVTINMSSLNSSLTANNSKVEFPELKSGWRFIQTDVFPQSAGAAGDGIELYKFHLDLMRGYEKVKNLSEYSVRHATPDEVAYYLWLKFLKGRKKPLFNQRSYVLLTDIQSDDGGVVCMRPEETTVASGIALTLIARHSRVGQVGCLAVIEPDEEAKPPKKMLDVSGF